jgi:very-short-patch-repair endonuclease
VTFAERNQRCKETPEAALGRVAARQHSLFTWAQAIQAGFSPAAITRRVSSRRWDRVLPRVYRITGSPKTERQTALAACLWAGDGAVVSHRTAGVLWKMDGVAARQVEITVHAKRAPSSALVVVHRTLHLPPADQVTIGGIPITSPARTLIDLAGSISEESLETAVECALGRGLVRESVLRWSLGGRGRGGADTLRRMLGLRDPGSPALESRLEVTVWRLLVRSGLPKPLRQQPVEVDGRRYRLDFAWPSFLVAVEADGFATHGACRRVFHADRRRVANLASTGWRVVPVTWEDATTRADEWLRGLGRTLALAS